MSQPSMAEAAKIRDVAARHAYVFDNGLCSPDFFDVKKRMASEEFGLLRERVHASDDVLEVGCFTGLNLLGLRKIDHEGRLTGVEFVAGALEWMTKTSSGYGIVGIHGKFPDAVIHHGIYDVAICFDVLEHQLNVGEFLLGLTKVLRNDGCALVLVPIEKHYYDCGHVAFFPDAECLRNVLDYYFDVEEIFELKTCRKLFASCRRRTNDND